MFELTRKQDDTIICKLADGSEVEITLIEMRGSKATVGIEATEAVRIVRDELSLHSLAA